MMTITKTRGVVLAALMAAGFFLSDRAAQAVTFSSATGLGLNIPDDKYDGTFDVGTIASSAISVPALPGTITDVNVTIAMSHTYIGDLTIKLVSPAGTEITLLNRPGFSGPDDGTGTGGDGSDLSVAIPITFDDQAPSDIPHDAEEMGVGLSDSEIVGTHGTPTVYVPDADPSPPAPFDTLSVYNGETTLGDWTLYIGDSATETSGGTGFLDHWSLDIQTTATAAVPEANTAALAGVALLAVVMLVVSRRGVAPAPIRIRKSKMGNDET
jgi:subtilisin-like proprotein convertase family protein